MEEAGEIEVLVVGAGPTGLTLAAILAQAGIRVRIVDKNPARSDKSKALGVQAGTLEALEAQFGASLTKRMVQIGQPARTACLHLDGRSPVAIDLSTIPSPYNYILILDQSETERLLGEELNQLGVEVEWNTELSSLEVGEEGVDCRVRAPDEKVTGIKARYVVGCDGAHSKVRHELGIPFQGGAYEGSFILGDVMLDWKWKSENIRAFISANGIMACFPMNDRGKHRLIMIPKPLEESEENSISLEDFSRIANKLAGTEVKVSHPVWLTRFRIHHRMVSSFRKANAFLAGDAAHIHSPVGAQGMNTGIQDSLNLGDKLIKVLRKGVDAGLLDQYEKERMPVAKRVVRSTDFVFRMGLLPESKGANWARRLVIPRIAGCRFVQRRVVKAVSQIAVARREIAERKR